VVFVDELLIQVDSDQISHEILLSRAGGGSRPVEAQQPLLLKKGAKECRLF